MGNKMVIAFVANWIFWIIVYEFVVLKKVRSITHGDPKLHARYPAFRRLDAAKFTNRLQYWPLVWIFPFRFLLTVIGMLGMSLVGLMVVKLKPRMDEKSDFIGFRG